MATIADEKYVRLTTFTRDGRPKPSPVWIADLGDGTVGFTTELGSWKTKRIANTPKIELAPSDVKGEVADDASAVTGTAVVVSHADASPIEAAIKAKYGWQFRMVSVLAWFKVRFGKADPTPCGVVITLD